MSDLTSPFTGLFSRWGQIARRPHDPAVPCWAGVLPRWGDGDLAVGGAAWTVAGAEAAALGEAVERWRSRPLAGEIIEASYAGWRRDEDAIAPERWVLFSDEQHDSPGFPFAPLRDATECGWACCRDARTGAAAWVPAALVYLQPGMQQFAPSVSTGLSAGRRGDPVLLRGVQELIERDALVGGWWGRYPLEEYDPAHVWRSLPADVPPRLVRPHLRWRFYRIDTPLSAHVTIVTMAGDDREGFCFAAGSACRSTRQQSWLKSLLEATQSWHYARYLKRSPLAEALRAAAPDSFAGHALYYSVHPERLRQTPLETARSADGEDTSEEDLAHHLRERLQRPILFRILTPPGLAAHDWLVLRVLIPGLQPLHGHHSLPFLGGPLWAPRRLADWANIPPHPFP